MVRSMRKCPNCGEKLQDSDRVCRNCGAFLDVVPMEDDTDLNDEDTPKKNNDEQDSLDIPSYNEENRQNKDIKQKRRFYWKAPILFAVLGTIMLLSSLLIRRVENKQEFLIEMIFNTAIVTYIVAGIAFLIVIILYIIKKEFHFTMTAREIIDSNASPTEQRKMAFVGKNYVKISKLRFSLSAFFFNCYYLLYRKLYLVAFLEMSLIIALIAISNYIAIIKYVIIAFILATSILLGLFFNKQYVKYVNKKTKRLKEKNSNIDVESFLQLCKKKGGTSLFSSTIIYTLFLIIIVLLSSLSIFKTKITKSDKQEQLDVQVEVIDREYQQKRAQCKSYAKAVYQSYSQAQLDIDYIGCKFGKEKYIILRVKNTTSQSYIAKYEINQSKDELQLLNTTLELELLREKQKTQVLTKEEQQQLAEKEKIETDFNSFDKKIEEDKSAYKKDPTYIRNYIKIDINSLN